MGSYDKKLAAGAKPFLDDGEDLLAAFVARPRGSTQRAAGSLTLGASQIGKANEGAEASGFALANPMALGVTGARLLALSIGSPIGLGIGGKVKGIAGSASLPDVDSITTKRLAVGKTVTVTISGSPFVLEVGAGADVKGFIEVFEQAKGT